MRHLVNGPRQSGRTYNFVMNLPEDTEVICIVAYSNAVANHIKEIAKEHRGVDFSMKIKFYGLKQLSSLRGIDPHTVFFEHTAYEMATISQYKEICMVENLCDIWSEE